MATEPILVKPRDLPEAADVYADDAMVVDNGVTVGRGTPVQVVNAGAPVASQSEAIAGVDNAKRMTALRVKQVLDNEVAPAVLRAQAWAESPINPDPNDPNSKSAKTWAAEAEAEADRAEVAAATINLRGVDDEAALAALDHDQYGAGFVFDLAVTPFLWDPSDLSAEITAGDPRYVAPASDPTGASGARVMAGSVWDGKYSRSQGGKPQRIAGRVFGGAASGFGGEWSGPAGMTGLDPLARALHNWAFRDGGLVYDDHAGAMAIVGHTQTSREANWPGYPANKPAGIGVSGFAINDAPGGYNPAWGGYFDAVRLNNGFTVGIEATVANASGEGAVINPFNVKGGGAQAGTVLWSQIGAGLDHAWPEFERVNHSSAHVAMLSSYREDGTIVPWYNAQEYIVGRAVYDGTDRYVCLVAHTAPASGSFAAYRAANPTHWQVMKTGDWAASVDYVVGDLATDPSYDVTFRCLVPHTSSGAFFSAYRAANPTHWKQLPSAKKGMVIGAGAVAEAAPGSGVFAAVDMPERHQISWLRNKAGTAQQSAFIWATNIPDDSPPVGITFGNGLIDLTATNGVRADAARIGGASNYMTVSRGSGANDNVSFTAPGTGVVLWYLNGDEQVRFDTAGIRLPTGKVLRVNGLQVVGARKTGWSLPTGTATRTTFDTSSVTLPQLAERVNALIADLHATAGHGLIGA